MIDRPEVGRRLMAVADPGSVLAKKAYVAWTDAVAVCMDLLGEAAIAGEPGQYHRWQTWPQRIPTCDRCGVRQTDSNVDRTCPMKPAGPPNEQIDRSGNVRDKRQEPAPEGELERLRRRFNATALAVNFRTDIERLILAERADAARQERRRTLIECLGAWGNSWHDEDVDSFRRWLNERIREAADE